jgi:hypothetical protein
VITADDLAAPALAALAIAMTIGGWMSMVWLINAVCPLLAGSWIPAVGAAAETAVVTIIGTVAVRWVDAGNSTGYPLLDEAVVTTTVLGLVAAAPAGVGSCLVGLAMAVDRGLTAVYTTVPTAALDGYGGWMIGTELAAILAVAYLAWETQYSGWSR